MSLNVSQWLGAAMLLITKISIKSSVGEIWWFATQVHGICVTIHSKAITLNERPVITDVNAQVGPNTRIRAALIGLTHLS